MDDNNPYRRVENSLHDANGKIQNMDQTSDAPPPAYSSFFDTGTATASVERQPTMVTINSSTAVPPSMPIIPQPVGPNSAQMTCPHCRCRVQSRISHRATAKTHIACLLLSWTCCCCCLPYCMDSCRNTNHFCPMCGAFLGTYSS